MGSLKNKKEFYYMKQDRVKNLENGPCIDIETSALTRRKTLLSMLGSSV